jgi:hypothetical protein
LLFPGKAEDASAELEEGKATSEVVVDEEGAVVSW